MGCVGAGGAVDVGGWDRGESTAAGGGPIASYLDIIGGVVVELQPVLLAGGLCGGLDVDGQGSANLLHPREAPVNEGTACLDLSLDLVEPHYGLDAWEVLADVQSLHIDILIFNSSE